MGEAILYLVISLIGFFGLKRSLAKFEQNEKRDSELRLHPMSRGDEEFVNGRRRELQFGIFIFTLGAIYSVFLLIKALNA